MHTRRLSLALLATLSASAALFIAQPASAAQGKFDTYTQGQRATDKPDPFTQGAIDKPDPFTQGADRQADTYGYLSWKNDRFDPYAPGADRLSGAHDVLAWRGDSSYPSDSRGPWA